jgi:hypothetical protein
MLRILGLVFILMSVQCREGIPQAAASAVCYSIDSVPGGAAAVAQLLLQLQDMTQLTHLDLAQSLGDVDIGIPPAAAFSALMDSSDLQHLNVKHCLLPEGVWRHVFPAGRQLPHMQSVVFGRCEGCRQGVNDRQGAYRLQTRSSWQQPCQLLPWAADVGHAVPALRQRLLCALPGLSRLTMLRMGDVVGVSGTEALEAVCQLTGLRDLQLISHSEHRGVLLLTDLKQLTHLRIQRVMGCLYFTVGVMLPL